MPLSNVTKTCGNGNVPGTKQRVYFVQKGDISTFASASASTNYGDTKTFDTAFTLAASKKWHELDILVNTGDVIDNVQGEVGGQFIQNDFVFFVPDYNKEQRMLVDDLIANSGCLIMLVTGKDGKVSILGNLENPLYVQTLTAGVGGPETTRIGLAVRVYAQTGYSCPIYTGAIDLTA